MFQTPEVKDPSQTKTIPLLRCDVQCYFDMTSTFISKTKIILWSRHSTAEKESLFHIRNKGYSTVYQDIMYLLQGIYI
jgi:hypothetical protein